MEWRVGGASERLQRGALLCGVQPRVVQSPVRAVPRGARGGEREQAHLFVRVRVVSAGGGGVDVPETAGRRFGRLLGAG